MERVERVNLKLTGRERELLDLAFSLFFTIRMRKDGKIPGRPKLDASELGQIVDEYLRLWNFDLGIRLETKLKWDKMNRTDKEEFLGDLNDSERTKFLEEAENH